VTIFFFRRRALSRDTILLPLSARPVVTITVVITTDDEEFGGVGH